MRSDVSCMIVCSETRSKWWRRGLERSSSCWVRLSHAFHLGGMSWLKRRRKIRVVEAGGQEVEKVLIETRGLRISWARLAPMRPMVRVARTAGLHGQTGAGEDVVHELGDFLHLLDLGIGEGAVVGLDTEGQQERGRGTCRAGR